mmetsp:Transcript_28708/g.27501  ORF Transcript_28708/g.27501 Transcript_28708/m.27501 type:complete len:327 (-) Transcript_28708:266-1246(-)
MIIIIIIFILIIDSTSKAFQRKELKSLDCLPYLPLKGLRSVSGTFFEAQDIAQEKPPLNKFKMKRNSLDSLAYTAPPARAIRSVSAGSETSPKNGRDKPPLFPLLRNPSTQHGRLTKHPPEDKEISASKLELIKQNGIELLDMKESLTVTESLSSKQWQQLLDDHQKTRSKDSIVAEGEGGFVKWIENDDSLTPDGDTLCTVPSRRTSASTSAGASTVPSRRTSASTSTSAGANPNNVNPLWIEPNSPSTYLTHKSNPKCNPNYVPSRSGSPSLNKNNMPRSSASVSVNPNTVSSQTTSVNPNPTYVPSHKSLIPIGRKNSLVSGV